MISPVVPRSWRRALVSAGTALLVLAAPGAVGPQAAPVEASGRASASASCTRNGRIASVRDFPREGKNYIYTIKPGGKGLTKITESGSAWSPAWSPDGEHLLYDGKLEGDTDVEIYQIDADGSNPINLTDNEWSDGSPAWSADGEWIAFASLTSPDDFDFELFKMRSDGSELTQLTHNEVQDWTPSWSPNGRRIVYASNDKVKVMNQDGSGVKKISGKLLAAKPDWRPQGGWIVFHADHYHSGGVEIWKMRPDGSKRRRLTTRSGPDQSPSWSPDGTRIAYSKDWKLAVMRRDGSGSKAIHEGVGDVYAPDWQPRCDPESARL